MTRGAGTQELESHHSREKERLGTWAVNSPATSVVSLEFMVRAPGGKVTPALKGRGEGESVLGRERTRSWQKPPTLTQDEEKELGEGCGTVSW